MANVPSLVASFYPQGLGSCHLLMANLGPAQKVSATCWLCASWKVQVDGKCPSACGTRKEHGKPEGGLGAGTLPGQ